MSCSVTIINIRAGNIKLDQSLASRTLMKDKCFQFCCKISGRYTRLNAFGRKQKSGILIGRAILPVTEQILHGRERLEKRKKERTTG